jgi:predicted CXXCH cytochrome family protein
MRRLVLFTAGLVVSLFVGAVPASADNGPHMKGAGPIADTCASCHRVHTAKAPRLLKEAQSALCYSCHGAGGTGANNDVVDGVGYSEPGRTGSVGALRGGGFKYALIDTKSPVIGEKGSLGVIPVRETGAEVTSTHSVDTSEQTAWGFKKEAETPEFGRVLKLSCGTCHDPHGNGNYRILRSTPRELYSKGEVGAPEVAIADAETKVYTTTNYWLTSDVNSLSFAEKISAWCTTCHTRYLADHQGSEYSGDPVYSYRHSTASTSQGAGQRNCVQCHVSHGSNASMGANSAAVTFPDGSAAGADSRLLRADNRGVCQLCHNK